MQDNGGFTLTHALLSGSPAIDKASPYDFPSTDERGVARPQDGDGDTKFRADIGAFEKETTSALHPSATVGMFARGQPEKVHKRTRIVEPAIEAKPHTIDGLVKAVQKAAGN